MGGRLVTQNDRAALASTRLALGFSDAIAGAHAARSMMFHEMGSLVHALPREVSPGAFAKAVIEENVLAKPTQGSRRKTLRHFTQLYGLDPSKALFRVFWALCHTDFESLAQLCLVCAYARDPLLRLSFDFIRTMKLGELMNRPAMEQHLENVFPGRFSPAMKKSMAQNVITSWSYGGHLAGRKKKTRQLPEPRPISAAYAMFVGYLAGLRGVWLLDSDFAALVSSNRSQLQAALVLASARGLLSLKQAAGIVEFDFSSLLTPAEQELIHESH